MGLLAGAVLPVFLVILAVLTKVEVFLTLGMFIGAVFYGMQLLRWFSTLPQTNIMRLFSLTTGLFYCGGTALFLLVREIFGDMPVMHEYEPWRVYETVPLALSALFMFSCSYAALALSYRIKPVFIGRLYSQRQFSEAIGDNFSAWDTVAGLGFVLVIAAIAAWLLVMGKLTVAGGLSVGFAPIDSYGQWVALCAWAVPATVLLMLELSFRNGTSNFVRMVLILAAIPIALAIFTFGRRWMVSSLLVGVISIIVFTRVRLSFAHWVALAAAGSIGFAVLSGPFMVLRNLKGMGYKTNITMLFTSDIGSSASIGAKHKPEEFLAMTAYRAELHGELARVSSQMPWNPQYGKAFFSQLASTIPGALWKRKAEYLSREMWTDYTVCAAAGLPPQDLAGSMVLYSFVELSWLGCVWFSFMSMVLMVFGDLMIRMSRSYSHYLIVMCSLLFFAFIPDQTDGAQVVMVLRDLLLSAVVFSMARFLSSWARSRNVSAHSGGFVGARLARVGPGRPDGPDPQRPIA